MRLCWTLIGALALPGLAQASEAEWLRCAELRDSAPRLACYDALAAALRTGAARNPEAPPPPRAADPLAGFGLREPVPAQQVNAVESRMPGRFEGWEPRQVLVLENGQRWRVVDDSSATLNLHNPRVWVRRGALGSFRFEVEGSNSSARVQRVQ